MLTPKPCVTGWSLEVPTDGPETAPASSFHAWPVGLQRPGDDARRENGGPGCFGPELELGDVEASLRLVKEPTPGTSRNKDATNGAPGHTTRNKDATNRAKGIATNGTRTLRTGKRLPMLIDSLRTVGQRQLGLDGLLIAQFPFQLQPHRLIHVQFATKNLHTFAWVEEDENQ